MGQTEHQSADATRVLLLDDDPAAVRLVRTCLNPGDDGRYDLTAVDTAAALRTEIDRHPDLFDVILVGQNPRDGEGLEIVKSLSPELSAPIILLTGQAAPGLDVAALANGAADYLLKDTMDAESLRRTIRHAIARKRRDNTLRQDAAENAQTDPLTSLLNRTTIMEMLPGVVAINRRNGTHVALLYIDLDDFGAVNDTPGRRAGDEVLKSVADRVRGCIRGSDFAARIGGDEFAVALNNLKSPLGAASVAQNILDAIRRPRSVDKPADAGVGIVGARIGIAIFDSENCTPEHCLRNAKKALSGRKSDGGHGYYFFDPGMLDALELRRKFEADLSAAPGQGDLCLYYQPQVDLFDGRITGMEALLRWKTPGAGIVEPADFLRIAEESGALVELGDWVARAACAQLAAGTAGIPVSINISAKELHHPGLADNLASIVAAVDVAPGSLMVEVTESAVFGDIQTSGAVISDIRSRGIKVALDDFGTGYSSLSVLRNLSVDCLKIDGSFVRNICNSTVDAAIAKSVIDLGHRLGVPVVAECAETIEHVTCLRDMGCDIVQGFYFFRPMPAGRIGSIDVSAAARHSSAESS